MKIIVKDDIVVHSNPSEFNDRYCGLGAFAKDYNCNTTNSKAFEVQGLPEYYMDACYYYRNGKFEIIPEKESQVIEHYRNKALAVNKKLTRDKILDGFDYKISLGEHTLNIHFAYSLEDQQNFTDTAFMAQEAMIAASMGRRMDVGKISDGYSIKGYALEDFAPEQIVSGEEVEMVLSPAEFLTLFNEGALNHKFQCLHEGRQIRKALQEAKTLKAFEEAVGLLEASSPTPISLGDFA